MSLPECYVVFSKAKTLGWARKFLHKDISHCLVIWQEDDKWFKFDQSIDDVEICTITAVSDILNESVVVKIKRKETSGGLFALNTCVGAVKNFIGLRDYKTLTPYQLYQRILSWES